jgi:DNA-binding NarL/FixJ family response regulator
MRIVLADDQRVVRDGLAALLEKQPDIEVAGRAADGQDALDQVHKFKPDVLIIDVKMPHMDGVSATRRITAEWPSIAVIGLTMYDDDIRNIPTNVLRSEDWRPSRSSGNDGWKISFGSFGSRQRLIAR